MTDDPLRRDRESRSRRQPQRDPTAQTPPPFVAKVVTPSADVHVGRFFLANPLDVMGAEVEGGAGTFAVRTGQTVPIYLCGPGRPAQNDHVVARWANDRWATDFKTTGGIDNVPTPSCPCASMPPTLAMTSSHPSSNNGIFQNATIAYMATPSGLAPLGLPANAFFSTATFPDAFSDDEFRYYFRCLNGYYVLTRLYEESIYGSPYQDIIRYRWYIGLPGNLCQPFGLTNGTIFTGGDSTCVVSIVA